MPFGTKMGAVSAPAQAKPPAARWGDPGVSEGFLVQDQQLTPSPALQTLTLADAGILEELRMHISGLTTVTHGTGTNAKDIFGPYSFWQQFVLRTGSNTPLVYCSGRAMNILNMMEYPSYTWENVDVPQTVANPLTNTSDFFNYSATAGSAQVFRHWLRVPVALKWAGMPGGAVGHLILQNKKIANVIAPTFGLTGNTAPYSAASTAGYGSQPWNITGNDTVTFTGTMETWKKLYTVPVDRAQFPVYGFLRYISEVSQPYTSGSFTYNFEPGGVLLRTAITFVDQTVAGGMATSNLQSIAYQYGTNKQLDVFTPYSNIHQQLGLYGRPLPQGTFAFDYYTAKRSLVDAKSTENVANVQLLAQFAPTYNVPANSTAYILLDKVYIVQNYLGS